MSLASSSTARTDVETNPGVGGAAARASLAAVGPAAGCVVWVARPDAAARGGAAGARYSQTTNHTTCPIVEMARPIGVVHSHGAAANRNEGATKGLDSRVPAR